MAKKWGIFNQKEIGKPYIYWLRDFERLLIRLGGCDMKRKRRTGQILYKSVAKKSKKAVAVLMAALMVGSVVDYTALPVVYAAEDNTSEQVAELTQNGETTVYSSFMEAYQAINTSDEVTIKLLQDSKISKITGSNYTYINDAGHTIVLDLNGHTLGTEEVSGWDSKEYTCVLGIAQSSNWTICSGVSGGKIQDSYSKVALFENYGTLAIGENVEITSNSEYTVFARGGTGILSIDGADIDKVGAEYGFCKITSGNIDNVFWRGGKVEISGGKIGTLSVIGDYAGSSSGSNLQLSGGTIDLLKQREEYTKLMNTWFATGTVIRSTKDDSLYTRAGIDAIEAVEGYRSVENIVMVPCENHVNESGYCKYCATATECEHIYGEDGICTNCGLVATATIKKDNQLTGYITYGELCQAVSEFTPDTTATIKIMKDVDLNQSLTFQEGKITLDLGGHKIETARVNAVIVADNAEVTIQNGTLKTRDNDVVGAKGGKLTLEKGTTVSSCIYKNSYPGLRIDGGEVTIDGAEFVAGDMSVDISSGKLTVLDGTFNGRIAKYFYKEEESPEVSLRGGSYSDVRALVGNIRSMLENGYGFRSREEGAEWIVDSDLLDWESTEESTAKKLSNVTVEKLPLTITQPESYEDYCGNPAWLHVKVDKAEGVTYQWYRITEEGNAEEVSGATSNTLEISPQEFEPGVGITFYCMIYWQGYSIKSEEATVTELQAENKFVKELTCKDYVYNGVTAPNPEATAKFGTVKYRYATSEIGEYTDAVPMNAGIYYVKAYVEETKNYTGLESKEAVKFVISKAKQPKNTPKNSITTAYTVKKVSQVELPSGWQWAEEDAEKDIPEAKAVEAKANYVGQDKDNYETNQVTITITRTRSACEHPGTRVEGEKAATCTATGYTGDSYCEQCGRKIKEGTEIAMLPHTLEKIEKKDATTVEEGNIEYYHCSVCDSYFSDSEGKEKITKESTVIPVIEVTPTTEPTTEPTAGPAAEPTVIPSVEPTAGPAAEPTVIPSVEPTAKPTAEPMVTPSVEPTVGPTAEPSVEPTVEPTVTPTITATTAPTAPPTEKETPKSTKKPVVKPAKKGTKLTDSKGVTYKVTSDKVSSPTVAYAAAAKGAKGTIIIPAQVKIKGVTYKVTSVGASACKNNAKITKVTIGNNVTKIGSQAFSGCKKLKTVVIGAKVSAISQKAFYKCTTIKSITIPAKVTSIGKSAFASCKNLEKVTIKTTKLTKSKVGSNAFSGISSKAVVKVPKSKVKAYSKLLKEKGISDKATITK